jgi:hypothetical protein
VFGKNGTWPAVMKLSSLDGKNGFKITGNLYGEESGYSVSAGDINHDGYSDIIVGARGRNGDKGRVVVVYGAQASGDPPLDVIIGTVVGGFVAVVVAGVVIVAILCHKFPIIKRHCCKKDPDDEHQGLIVNNPEPIPR